MHLRRSSGAAWEHGVNRRRLLHFLQGSAPPCWRSVPCLAVRSAPVVCLPTTPLCAWAATHTQSRSTLGPAAAMVRGAEAGCGSQAGSGAAQPARAASGTTLQSKAACAPPSCLAHRIGPPCSRCRQWHGLRCGLGGGRLGPIQCQRCCGQHSQPERVLPEQPAVQPGTVSVTGTRTGRAKNFSQPVHGDQLSFLPASTDSLARLLICASRHVIPACSGSSTSRCRARRPPTRPAWAPQCMLMST